MPDLSFHPSPDIVLGKGHVVFHKREGKWGKLACICFYYAITPLHQQFLREKGEFFFKVIPHDVHARSVPAAEGSSSGADESALKGTAAVRSHNAFCFLLIGEWAFSLGRLFSSFRQCVPEPFPKRMPKVSFGKSLLPFFSSRKERPAPA